MAVTVLSALLLLALTGTVGGTPCNTVLSDPTGTVTQNNTALAGQDCTYTIMRDAAATENTVVEINVRALAIKDSLQIYDGAQSGGALLLNYTSPQTVELQVAIVFGQNATIVFRPAANQTTSQWSVTYNAQACQVNLTNTWSKTVDLPVYKPTAGKNISCTYNIESSLPVVQSSAITFMSWKLNDTKNTLTVSSGTNNVTVAGGDPIPNDFFAQGDEPIVLTLNISDASKPAGSFSLLVESVVTECSGAFFANETKEVGRSFPPDYLLSECRWLLSTEKKSLMGSVSSLQLVAGSDRLDIIDAGTSGGSTLGSISGNVTNYLVASTGKFMIISIKFGNIRGVRSINASVTETDLGGRLTGQGPISSAAGPTAPGDIFYQLVASPGKVVSVADVATTNLTGTTVTFYNGLQTTDPKLAVFGGSNSQVYTVTGGSQVLVAVSNLAPNATFNATFTSVPAGCDLLATDTNGRYSYSEDPAETAAETCTWTIAPVLPAGSDGGDIVVFLEAVNLGGNDSVQIYAGLDNKKLVAQYKNVTLAQGQLPQVMAPVNEKIRVVITRNATYRAETSVVLSFSVTEQACDGKLQESKPQESKDLTISTPNYPNQYPLNAQCTWAADNGTAKENQTLYISFQDLVLAQQHAVSVVDVVNGTSTVLAQYGGISQQQSSLPADLVIPFTNGTQVTFTSARNYSAAVVGDINQVGRGAKLSYRVLNCGGNISTASGSFMTPDYPKSPTNSAFCVWIIDVSGTAKPDTTNIVNFTIQAVDPASEDQYLIIYDGSSRRNTTFQVNKTKTYELSRYDKIVVEFNYTATLKIGGFMITYSTKTCSKSEQCDNGICLHSDWRCNGIDDCGDNTDEKNCSPIAPTVAPVTQKPQTDYSGYVKSGWVAGCLIIGLILGVVLVIVVPKIVRRLRGGASNYSRMSDDRPVV